jgi:outer membrane protein OmpA-like peptidoglycan-associated protein
MDLGVLTDVVRIGDEFRRNLLDWFGPLAPIMTAAAQGLAAAVGLIALGFGKTYWAPPTPLADFAVRISGLVIFLGVVGLFVWSKNGGNALHFLLVGLAATLIGIIGALFYLNRWSSLCFKCEFDPATYVRGLELNPNAAKVLAGDLVGLPAAYVPTGRPPADEFDYFCNSGKNPNFIWQRDSHNRAQMRLVRTYLIFAVPIALGLTSAATALTQPEIRIAEKVISLPGDVLFDYNKWDLRPGAVISLDETAKIMRQRGVTTARIEGHTDSIGGDEFNKMLSKRRADTVRSALAGRPGLDKVQFTTDGLGATRPVAPNDTEANRAKNRRVTILLDR